MTRHLSLVPPLARCEHTVQRGLTWRCTLPPHGPDQRHVFRTVR